MVKNADDSQMEESGDPDPSATEYQAITTENEASQSVNYDGEPGKDRADDRSNVTGNDNTAPDLTYYEDEAKLSQSVKQGSHQQDRQQGPVEILDPEVVAQTAQIARLEDVRAASSEADAQASDSVDANAIMSQGYAMTQDRLSIANPTTLDTSPADNANPEVSDVRPQDDADGKEPAHSDAPLGEPSQQSEVTAEVNPQTAAVGNLQSSGPVLGLAEAVFETHDAAGEHATPENVVYTNPAASIVAEEDLGAPEDNRAQLLVVLGLDTHRHNNALVIDDDTLVTCVGSHLVFVSLSSDRRRYLRGLDGGGVGAVAVHPSRTLLAVGEKARRNTGPCVYIYTYPELKCIKVLRAGTERAYSALAFDLKGDTLASVGSFPDFLLTLWDWRAESIVLRAKAFSQDVYTVAFSPFFEGQLTTSGQGHIRFWRMASTFTGLKLQGALGKFGNVELSDVAGFVELPDGKVLSTTETGELLLWDGGLIKVVLLRPGAKPCHDGPVEVLLHDRASGVILSAGADGYVRVWDFNQVNDAEPREDGHSLELKPLDEVLVAPGAHLVALMWEGRRWVAVDLAGRIYVIALPVTGSISKGASVLCVGRLPAGAVAGLAPSPQSHVCISASRDGQMRVLDYRTGTILAEAASLQPITVFAPIPASAGATSMAAVAGYRDGVVRVFTRSGPLVDLNEPDSLDSNTSPFPQDLALIGVAKPHKGAVLALAVSQDAARLASCGDDGTVFFFDMAPVGQKVAAADAEDASCGVLVPRAYVRLAQGGGAVTCATWSADGRTLLLGTNRGTILQVTLPPEGLDTHHSYEWTDAIVHSYTFCVPKPKRPKKAQKSKDRKEGDNAGERGEAQEGGSSGQVDGDAAKGDSQAGEEGAGQGEDEEEEGEEEGDEDGDQGSPDELAATCGELLTIALAPDDPATLLVTAGGNGHAARKVWRVNLNEPLAAPLLDGFASAPITFFGYSADGSMALLGSGDGLVRVQALDGPYGAPLGPYWESALHDMQTGRVTAVAVSYDGAYLLSAARDGSVHLLMLQLFGSVEPQEAPLEDLPDARMLPAPVDVTSPTAYTLEEEKQQAERDQQVRMAEEKKLSVRERLARIRAEFEVLLAENEAQAEALRLSRDELVVDPGLRDLMEAEALRREEVARLELAWESERQRLGLAKLRSYFLDGVETERVALYSLRNGSVVTTFRTARLSEETRAELAALRAAAAAAACAAVAGGDGAGRDGIGGDARKGSDTGGGPAGDAAARARLAEATAALEEGTASGKLNKADLRRLSRKRREAEWAAFNATRPDDTYDSPADLKAIEC
ncbi:hypothetical protein Vretimale_15319 [Volvox reticuliferus]|uniref:EML-like first beta-propeller domain-containing protein n=1 Tax=Volvox reticuliferus TaxID=1737510 RepID=A0A8J4GNV6_9CHLO|nr:hypothetical protein Vretimale_15319 [Volvox reticuliferus]